MNRRTRVHLAALLRQRNPRRGRTTKYLTDSAYWLVPALWLTSGICLGAELVGASREFGHVSIWLALLAVTINSHALARHTISRLTQIIALWQEDVQTGDPPPPLSLAKTPADHPPDQGRGDHARIP